jgi:hypothetical protein
VDGNGGQGAGPLRVRIGVPRAADRPPRGAGSAGLTPTPRATIVMSDPREGARVTMVAWPVVPDPRWSLGRLTEAPEIRRMPRLFRDREDSFVQLTSQGYTASA